jgi:hypothetical protein
MLNKLTNWSKHGALSVRCGAIRVEHWALSGKRGAIREEHEKPSIAHGAIHERGGTISVERGVLRVRYQVLKWKAAEQSAATAGRRGKVAEKSANGTQASSVGHGVIRERRGA